MSINPELEQQAFDFEKINALLCNYAAACSLVATHLRARTYETDTEIWLKVLNNYREKHREMLKYMAGDEAVSAYYGELTSGKHCKDCWHHRGSEIGVDRCYFTYPPQDTEAHKPACRCFKPKEGEPQ